MSSEGAGTGAPIGRWRTVMITKSHKSLVYTYTVSSLRQGEVPTL